MSGGGGSAPSSAPLGWASEQQGYTSADVEAYMNSAESAGQDRTALQTLKTATYAGGKYYGSLGAAGGRQEGAADITSTANAFMAWKAQQGASASAFNNYADAVKAQPGRDQTILTGPAANPSRTLVS